MANAKLSDTMIAALLNALHRPLDSGSYELIAPLGTTVALEKRGKAERYEYRNPSTGDKITRFRLTTEAITYLRNSLEITLGQRGDERVPVWQEWLTADRRNERAAIDFIRLVRATPETSADANLTRAESLLSQFGDAECFTHTVKASVPTPDVATFSRGVTAEIIANELREGARVAWVLDDGPRVLVLRREGYLTDIRADMEGRHFGAHRIKNTGETIEHTAGDGGKYGVAVFACSRCGARAILADFEYGRAGKCTDKAEGEWSRERADALLNDVTFKDATAYEITGPNEFGGTFVHVDSWAGARESLALWMRSGGTHTWHTKELRIRCFGADFTVRPVVVTGAVIVTGGTSVTLSREPWRGGQVCGHQTQYGMGAYSERYCGARKSPGLVECREHYDATLANYGAGAVRQAVASGVAVGDPSASLVLRWEPYEGGDPEEPTEEERAAYAAATGTAEEPDAGRRSLMEAGHAQLGALAERWSASVNAAEAAADGQCGADPCCGQRGTESGCIFAPNGNAGRPSAPVPVEGQRGDVPEPRALSAQEAVSADLASGWWVLSDDRKNLVSVESGEVVAVPDGVTLPDGADVTPAVGATYTLYLGEERETAHQAGVNIPAEDVRRSIEIGREKGQPARYADDRGTIQVGGTWWVRDADEVPEVSAAERAANLAAEFLPQDPADESTYPCVMLPTGEQVHAYRKGGRLVVSVDLDTAEITRAGGTVPMVITVQGRTVYES